MSAESFGAHMPATLTLDDLAEMAAADGHGHRYEMSPEGVLSVMPPAGVAHTIIASKLLAWFLAAGWAADQVLQNCGLRTAVQDGVGGRVPDLTVWSTAPAVDLVWAPLEGLILAVEIVSRGSEAIDHIIKKDEYAKAGIPRYWTVDRDNANTVTMWELASDGYAQAAPSPQPLAWVLNSDLAQKLR
ncbi:Uma2 family endonuclease [Dactylosporangium sp. CA-233914]|uniref:Uma2 family endonuclease n=1 Tax=Dactylosporangium sp. CA-233914 TaxID=3239934 RepID=UPI003D946F47